MSIARHLLFCASLAACAVAAAAPAGNGAAASAPPAAAPSGSAPAFPRTLKDGAGRTVVLPAAPQRLVSLSPAVTETVLAVDAGDELVGVTRYCPAPPSNPTIARVGGILDPDYEHILALQPDLVLIPPLADAELQKKLASLGLRVLIVYPEGLNNLAPDLRLVGAATGHDQQADALARQWEQLRALVRQRIATVPPAQIPTAVVLYIPGLLAPSPDGFAGQLLAEAGARNLVPAGDAAWRELSPETLLQLDPGVIFIVSSSPGATWPPASDPAFQNLSAVRHGRVVELPQALFMRPGPEQGEALWLLARALHPTLFREKTGKDALAPPAAIIPAQ